MSATEIGRQFVVIYFKVFADHPDRLISFFKEESVFAKGDPQGITSYAGLNEINEGLTRETNCLLDLRNIAIQSCSSNILITVTGYHVDSKEELRPFTQVFVLCPQEKPKKGHFVTNSIFLFTDGKSELQKSMKSEESKKVETVEPVQPVQPVAPAEEPVLSPVEEKVSVIDTPVKEEPVEACKAEEKKETSPRKGKKPQRDQKKKTKPSGPKNGEIPTKKTQEKAPEAKKEEKKEKLPSKPTSWASIAAKSKTSDPTSPVTKNPSASVSKKIEDKSALTAPSPSPAPSPSTVTISSVNKNPKNTRYLDVKNFNSSAKIDTLKEALKPFGVVEYVRFLGTTRATVVFEDAAGVTAALNAKIVKIGDKVVQVSLGSQAKQKRGKDGKQRGSNSGAPRGGRGAREQ